MGVWLVDSDVLAASRFATSPLIETINVLGLLASRDPQPWERSWLARYRGAFGARVAADPFSAVLIGTALAGSWLPVALGAAPRPADVSFDLELARLRAIPASVARADLAWSIGGGPLPAALDIGDPAGAVADLLQWTWDHALRRDWPRRRRIYQADIISRTAVISQRGWGAAISGLSPRVRWLGHGQLQISTRDRPPRDLRGADLVFIPGSVRDGRVAWDLPVSYAVIYPASGLLADPAARAAPAALRRLLGATRADILRLLDQPASTTQLVAATGLALGTVGTHLRVLLDARLVDRHRSGATVLYFRTPGGQQLLDQATVPAPADQPASVFQSPRKVI
jgi:DNA-binding transcriptional ArsR family regulator